MSLLHSQYVECEVWDSYTEYMRCSRDFSFDYLCDLEALDFVTCVVVTQGYHKSFLLL